MEKLFGSLEREAGHVTDVAVLYDKATAAGEVTVEARIRKGWLPSRAGGRGPKALALLDAAEAPADDAYMRYVRHVMRWARADPLDRVDDALAAFHDAQSIAPVGVGSFEISLHKGVSSAHAERD